ncbi:hypothetical protein BJY16_007659 [Actinoplanes octamycinicus]|uniref:Uncharacterized protein n=2 Tax=Actinoplanes octamycinicus TaxID=135948 RepID=A0A7W7H543_9ACTN|nr:hypothetical protein [Actinoplanes octamycinicus]GIE56841.1 hypothetical protein Aoc01nite_22430 [Actinoplanes octamycinicus]
MTAMTSAERIAHARKAADELNAILLAEGRSNLLARPWQQAVRRLAHNLWVDASDDDILAVAREDAGSLCPPRDFFIYRDDPDARKALNEQLDALVNRLRSLIREG